MRIFTSLLAALGASFLAMILVPVIGLPLLHFRARRLGPDQQGGIGWDLLSALRRPGFLLYLLLAFVAGFWVTYHH